MVRIRIDRALDSHWRPIIEHKLALWLASVSRQIERGELHFHWHESESPLNGGDFHCRFLGYGRYGQRYHAQTRHANGETALVDALARVRREVVRHTQRARL